MGTLDDSEIAGLHRSSYDPASRADVDTAQAKVRHGGPRLRWKDAIPKPPKKDGRSTPTTPASRSPTRWHATDTTGHVRRPGTPHVAEAVRQASALVYKTLPPEHATAAVEKETTAAQARRAWNNKTKRDPTEREQADEKRAKRAAEEEARGAGIALMGLYITATVQDPNKLSTATADVANSAGSAKLSVRAATGRKHSSRNHHRHERHLPAHAHRNRKDTTMTEPDRQDQPQEASPTRDRHGLSISQEPPSAADKRHAQIEARKNKPGRPARTNTDPEANKRKAQPEPPTERSGEQPEPQSGRRTGKRTPVTRNTSEQGRTPTAATTKRSTSGGATDGRRNSRCDPRHHGLAARTSRSSFRPRPRRRSPHPSRSRTRPRRHPSRPTSRSRSAANLRLEGRLQGGARAGAEGRHSAPDLADRSRA